MRRRRLHAPPPPPRAAAALLCRKIVSGQFDEENPFVLISAYPVAGNPDAEKADVVKSGNQAQRIQSSKKPDTVIEESTSSEAVEKLRRVTKAGCQLLSLFQNAEDDKNPAKERTQRTIPIGALQNTFQTGRICVQRIEFEQRLIYEGNAIEEERLLVGNDCAIIQCTNRGKKNISTKQSTTIREERATSVDC
ncbi:TMV resistance protein N-like [Dorcoceras hygrometricum]|uniref:TMV resistance protein N-like n=1 Tax=Dorcoceras hygrometricum TaxID=472368 RepID=A0A2Z7DFM8_9LAMI|nr:TMV resistance protein N-like [Dorcoceras hygrometricum]